MCLVRLLVGYGGFVLIPIQFQKRKIIVSGTVLKPYKYLVCTGFTYS